MKYIRTKDGRILSLNDFKYEKKYHWYHPNEKYLSKSDIGFTCWRWCFDDEYNLIPEVLGKMIVEKIKREECKFADTIEELCDEFVLENEIDIDSKCSLMNRKQFEMLKEAICEASKKTHKNCYGAIWTGKGLIYVAKMDDNGELKLI